jgi:hypothetical protein
MLGFAARCTSPHSATGVRTSATTLKGEKAGAMSTAKR